MLLLGELVGGRKILLFKYFEHVFGISVQIVFDELSMFVFVVRYINIG